MPRGRQPEKFEIRLSIPCHSGVSFQQMLELKLMDHHKGECIEAGSQ